MNNEILDKLIATLEATPSDELYKQLFGFYEKDYIAYLDDNHHVFESQYIIDAMHKLEVTEINVYDGTIQPPSKMFFHYLYNNAESGFDEDFFGGWSAHTLDMPNSPLRYLFVNGQGTEHFFQLKQEIA